MLAAADKAPSGQRDLFAPYLRAAIIFWRLQEEAAQESDDMTAQVDAVAERITCEEHFRSVAGRSFHTETDAVSLDDVRALPDPS